MGAFSDWKDEDGTFETNFWTESENRSYQCSLRASLTKISCYSVIFLTKSAS